MDKQRLHAQYIVSTFYSLENSKFFNVLSTVITPQEVFFNSQHWATWKLTILKELRASMIESCTVFCCYNLHLFNIFSWTKLLGFPTINKNKKYQLFDIPIITLALWRNCVNCNTFILWVIVSTILAWLLFKINWDDWSSWTNQIVALNWSPFLIIPVRKYDNILMSKLHYCKYKQI